MRLKRILRAGCGLVMIAAAACACPQRSYGKFAKEFSFDAPVMLTFCVDGCEEQAADEPLAEAAQLEVFELNTATASDFSEAD